MRIWLLLLLVLPTSLFAQSNLRYSVSNLLRYGNGEERVSDVSRHRDYFENLTDARISLSDLVLGFRLLHDAPPEFGVDTSGLTKRYLEFRKDDLYVRAGDSYTLYGRGLALNLYENRSLAFDTGLDGVKMEYKTRMVKASFTGGDIHYIDILDLTRVEDYRIRAGSVELTPYPFLSLGANIASGKCWLPKVSSYTYAQFDIPEYFASLSLGQVDLFASYAEKRTTEFNSSNGTHKGTAFYGSVAYTDESFGCSLEYKDYRFGIAGPRERDSRSRATRAFAFQNPPIVHKEHSFTLLSRYPHIIDFNDEVGFQFDLFYTLFHHLTGTVNFSAASRHYSFNPVDTGSVIPLVYLSTARKNSWLPSFSDDLSPFWEVYTEFQYLFQESGTDYVLLAFNRRSDDLTDEQIIKFGHPEKSVKATRTTAIPFSMQYALDGGWVLKIVSERQWVYEDANIVNKKYYNHLVSLSVAKSPTFSVTIRYEFTSDFGTVDKRRNWTALDTSFRLSDAHLVTFTVGGDRGGQICSNGQCRVVNPFLGVRASVVSYL